MFCPQCSAENNLRQKYCRRCGLQLTAALIALRGSACEALTRYQKDDYLLDSNR
jgi:predicted amidophosphoribosyltransferase